MYSLNEKIPFYLKISSKEHQSSDICDKVYLSISMSISCLSQKAQVKVFKEKTFSLWFRFHFDAFA